jgi:hypothetical protein
MAAMTLHDWLDIGTTGATFLLALFTCFLAVFTWRLARATVNLARETGVAVQQQIKAMRETSSDQIKSWHDQSKEQIGVRTWLALEARFDALEMKNHRKTLANQMPYTERQHSKMRDDVFNFFESVGIAYNNGCLQHKLAVASFSYHATCWWIIGKPYVIKERRDLRDDSVFNEFEKFAEAMTKLFPTIDQEALTLFLVGERHLCGSSSCQPTITNFE